MNEDDRPWFAPKRYGYGSGLPIAWQGWVMMTAHIAVLIALIASIARTPGRPAALVLLVLVVALAPMPFYARKTAGGWRWRWGDTD